MTFTNVQKNMLKEKVEAFLKANRDGAGKPMSQAKFCDMSGSSTSVISFLLQGKFNQTNASGTIILSDNVLTKINEFFTQGEIVYELANYTKVFNAIVEAKKYQQQRIIDGPKGSGKTFACLSTMKQIPRETYYVEGTTDMTSKRFIMAIADSMGVDNKGDRLTIRIRTCEKLLRDKLPCLIIDQAEKLPDSAFGSIQDIYDYKWLFHKMSIVIIGANDFYTSLLDKEKRKNAKAFPQFLSRFGVDPVFLQPKEKGDGSAKMICQKYHGITDRDVIAEFDQKSTDYRQLDKLIHNYKNNLKLASNDQSRSTNAA
ncbi:MAG: ATP-binding protein [Imperialibacter sp.]|uniref:ATP-binding protein n=1 Tax=Imperialibacter sp. TaxID=2038411 RepID=UPI0032EF65EA